MLPLYASALSCRCSTSCQHIAPAALTLLLVAVKSLAASARHGIHVHVHSFSTSNVLVQALERRGITALFPIQKSVFDPAMQGSDLVGRARTGSGKTLAFSLPIIEGILAQNRVTPPQRGRSPRALIVCPTRELAKQVATELATAASKNAISVVTVYGGTPAGPQIRDIRDGVDVIVGTPGRILDLLKKQRCAPGACARAHLITAEPS